MRLPAQLMIGPELHGSNVRLCFLGLHILAVRGHGDGVGMLRETSQKRRFRYRQLAFTTKVRELSGVSPVSLRGSEWPLRTNW